MRRRLYVILAVVLVVIVLARVRLFTASSAPAERNVERETRSERFIRRTTGHIHRLTRRVQAGWPFTAPLVATERDD